MSNEDCAGAFRCFNRAGEEEVPGCGRGTGAMPGWGYCYDPGVLLEDKGSEGCTSKNKCDECQGDCD
jgi:hypothetical protein